MRYALAALALVAVVATAADARAPAATTGKGVSNTAVRDLCVEITGREMGHPLRDCMASVDLFLDRYDVPRAAP